MAAIITPKMRIVNAQQFLESMRESVTLYDIKKEDGSPVDYRVGEIVKNFDSSYICVDNSNRTNVLPVIPDTEIHKTKGNFSLGPRHHFGVNECELGYTWKFLNKSIYNNLYIGIAKSTPWGDETTNPQGSGGGSEVLPPSPKVNIKTELESLYEVIAAKRIDANRGSLAIPYVEWEEGQTYTMYDDTDDEQPIVPRNYVVVPNVDTYRIFKCINNRVYSHSTKQFETVPSMVCPEDAIVDGMLELGDGYTWKFMYSVPKDATVIEDYIECRDIYRNDALGDISSLGMSTLNSYVSRINSDLSSIDNVFVENTGSNYWSYETFDRTTGTYVDNGITAKFEILQTGSDNVLHTVQLKGLPTSLTDKWGPESANALINSYLQVRKESIDPDTQNIVAKNSHFKIGELQATYDVVTNKTTATFLVESIDVNSDFDFTKEYKVNVIAPYVNVEGNGDKFLAWCRCQPLSTGGEVSKIVIENNGRGYTVAKKTSVEQGKISDRVNAVARAIISPPGGHGSNNIEELNAYFVVMDVEFVDEEQGYFPIQGESSRFRRLVLMTNVVDSEGNAIQVDRFIGPEHPYYNVDEWMSKNASAFPESEHEQLITKLNGYNRVSAKYGRVLYVENRKVVSRHSGQTENVRIPVEF